MLPSKNNWLHYRIPHKPLTLLHIFSALLVDTTEQSVETPSWVSLEAGHKDNWVPVVVANFLCLVSAVLLFLSLNKKLYCALSLFTQVYKWVPAIIMLGDNLAMDLASHPGGSSNIPSHVMLNQRNQS